MSKDPTCPYCGLTIGIFVEEGTPIIRAVHFCPISGMNMFYQARANGLMGLEEQLDKVREQLKQREI